MTGTSLTEALISAHAAGATGFVVVQVDGRRARIGVERGQVVSTELGFGHRTVAQALLAAGRIDADTLDGLWAREEGGAVEAESLAELGIAEDEAARLRVLECVRALGASEAMARFDEAAEVPKEFELSCAEAARALIEREPVEWVDRVYRCMDPEGASPWLSDEADRELVEALPEFAPRVLSARERSLLSLLERRGLAESISHPEWEAREVARVEAEARAAEEARLAEEARVAEEARLAEEARVAEEARLAEEARAAEEARLAEEARAAEEARLAEEARAAEEARLAEEARAAEEARLAEEARAAEEARLAEEARAAEEARLAEEARAAEEARLAEEVRAAEEARLAEEARAAEEARLAEEARAAEEARLAEEARAVEEARLAEEARAAEEARLAEEARAAEEARLAEEARAAEEARLAEEARAAEEARLAEEARAAEEARLAEEARAAEEARLAEEARAAEEARLAEEARAAEEARLAEEARVAEEARLAEEARAAEEARLAEEARAAEEARLAEEARAAEEARLAEEARAAEEARLAEEARAAEEARLAEEARAAEEARLAEEARAAEEARLAEEARVAEEARLAEEARAAEEARLAEEARAAEEARLAEEARAAEEARLAEEVRAAEEARLAEEARAAEEARLVEEVRLAREARSAEKARAAEAARLDALRYDEAVQRAEEARIAQQARLEAEARASEAASYGQQQFASSTNGWGIGAQPTQEPSWGDLIPTADSPAPGADPSPAPRARAAPSYAVRPPQVVDEATAENELWKIVSFDPPPATELSPFEAAFDGAGVEASLDASLESIVAYEEPSAIEPEIELTELSWAEASIPPLAPSAQPEYEPDLLEDALSDPSDSTEAARLRRQKLLRKAMENIGALNGPRPEPVGAQPVAAAPEPPTPAAVPTDATELASRIEQHHALLGKANRFELLGLKPTASRNEVKAAFLNLAKSFHPDRLPPALAHLAPKITAVFEAVREAYEHLYDDARRAEYARSLEKIVAPAPKPIQRSAGGESAAEAARRGEALLRKRDFHGAEEAFAQADATEPNAAHRAAQAWALYLDPTRKAELPRAKQMMLDAIKADPRCDRAHYQLGVIARVEGDLDKAERFFRDAISANPRHLEANQEIRLIEMRKAKAKKGLFGR